MNPNIEMNPLFTEKMLSSRIKELAAKINSDYRHEPVMIISVLKGAFMFTADLIRELRAPLSVEFIGVSSYSGTKSTGHVRITHDLTYDVEGRHILLVEDIVDTGKTIDYLMDVLSARHPRSLKICALLSKPEAHVMRHKLDYVGFEISKEFVVGYGLDLDGRYRELPYIAQVKAQ